MAGARVQGNEQWCIDTTFAPTQSQHLHDAVASGSSSSDLIHFWPVSPALGSRAVGHSDGEAAGDEAVAPEHAASIELASPKRLRVSSVVASQLLIEERWDAACRYQFGAGSKGYHPGYLSTALRDALGMADESISSPPYLDRMVQAGFPPGWMVESFAGGRWQKKGVTYPGLESLAAMETKEICSSEPALAPQASLAKQDCATQSTASTCEMTADDLSALNDCETSIEESLIATVSTNGISALMPAGPDEEVDLELQAEEASQEAARRWDARHGDSEGVGTRVAGEVYCVHVGQMDLRVDRSVLTELMTQVGPLRCAPRLPVDWTAQSEAISAQQHPQASASELAKGTATQREVSPLS